MTGLYKTTIMEKNLDDPIYFMGGVHRDCVQKVTKLRIDLVRKSDGFYLCGGAYDNPLDFSCWFHLDTLDEKVAPYHRMATAQLKRLSDNDSIKMKAGVVWNRVLAKIQNEEVFITRRNR